jgi:hypothetical protein
MTKTRFWRMSFWVETTLVVVLVIQFADSLMQGGYAALAFLAVAGLTACFAYDSWRNWRISRDTALNTQEEHG